MTPPPVRVNTFFQKNSKVPLIDSISKVFILLQLPLGIVRISLFPNINMYFVTLSTIYSFSCLCLFISYICLTPKVFIPDMFVASMCLFQYTFYLIIILVLNTRLLCYFNEMKKFNIEAGTELKVGKETISNTIQMVCSMVYLFGSFSFLFSSNKISVFEVYAMPSILTQNLELYFYGHILSLFMPRLRLIKHHILSLGSTNEQKKNNTEKTELYKMEKIMNLYHFMINAHNYMTDAIKWQILIALVTSFINLLCNCCFMSLSLIHRNGSLLSFVIFLGQVVGVMSPLFAICTVGDQVYGEVKGFREILATKLYETRLDKRSRSMARALLSWTETRDLSFQLLRMFAVDISLPFKFIGLLVTHLTILLQFEKVINP